MTGASAVMPEPLLASEPQSTEAARCSTHWRQAAEGAGAKRAPRTIPSGVIVYSRISGSCRLARVLRTVRARRTDDSSRMYWSRTTLSARWDTPCSERWVVSKRFGSSEVMKRLTPWREKRWTSEYMYSWKRVESGDGG